MIIDYDKLNATYVFFQFIWQTNDDNKPVWANSYHLDKLLIEQKALATLYREGNKAYVMFPHQLIADVENFRQQLTHQADFFDIKIDPIQACQDNNTALSIAGVDLYQLLFNAIVNSSHEKRLAELGIKTNIVKQEKPDAQHFCLVKPKDYYETHKTKDPYQQDEKYSRQHLTDEKYQEFIKADGKANTKRQVLLKNLVKELWIKQAIQAKQLPLELLQKRYPLNGLPHMVHLREIRALQGKNLMDELLPLMDVDFVRYNNYTVLPFPLKYLREMTVTYT